MVQKYFWPDIANLIGITQPPNRPSTMFGQSGLFYLGRKALRASTSRSIGEIARQSEKDIEETLLAHLLQDCSQFKESFSGDLQ